MFCRPESLTVCYTCGRTFRPFEYFYVIKRLLDMGGIVNPWYGVKYGECQNCRMIRVGG